MNLSFNQYRAIDMTIMAVLLAISEAIVTIAATQWFPDELFSVSTTLAIVCIVMMRWDGFAVVHAVLGGGVYCLVLGATPQQFAIYCAGNCGALIALIMFKAIGKKKIAEKFWLSFLYVLVAYIGLELGRWGISMILQSVGEDGASGLLIYLMVSDSITLLFAVLAVMISRKLDGLFEDQRSYILRINEEQRKEREAREKENDWGNNLY